MAITVFINKKSTQINEGDSLSDLLAQEGIRSDLGVAVAVNDSVVPKNLWDNTILQQNDRILIITATAGG